MLTLISFQRPCCLLLDLTSSSAVFDIGCYVKIVKDWFWKTR